MRRPRARPPTAGRAADARGHVALSAAVRLPVARFEYSRRCRATRQGTVLRATPGCSLAAVSVVCTHELRHRASPESSPSTSAVAEGRLAAGWTHGAPWRGVAKPLQCQEELQEVDGAAALKWSALWRSAVRCWVSQPTVSRSSTSASGRMRMTSKCRRSRSPKVQRPQATDVVVVGCWFSGTCT